MPAAEGWQCGAVWTSFLRLSRLEAENRSEVSTEPDPTARGRKRYRRLARTASRLCVVLGIWLLAAVVFALMQVERLANLAIHHYLGKQGLGAIRCVVRRLTPTQAELGPVEIRCESLRQTDIRAEVLAFRFSPSHVRRGRFRALTVHGLRLPVVRSGSRWSVPAWAGIAAALERRSQPENPAAEMSLEFDSLVLSDARLVFLADGREESLDCRGTGSIRRERLEFTCAVRPGGGAEVRLAGSIDRRRGDGRITLEQATSDPARWLPLARLVVDLTPELVDTIRTVRGRIEASGVCELRNWRPAAYRGEIRIGAGSLRIRGTPLEVRDLKVSVQADPPASGVGGFVLTAGEIEVSVRGRSVRIGDLDLRGGISAGQVSAAGSFTYRSAGRVEGRSEIELHVGAADGGVLTGRVTLRLRDTVLAARQRLGVVRVTADLGADGLSWVAETEGEDGWDGVDRLRVEGSLLTEPNTTLDFRVQADGRSRALLERFGTPRGISLRGTASLVGRGSLRLAPAGDLELRLKG